MDEPSHSMLCRSMVVVAVWYRIPSSGCEVRSCDTYGVNRLDSNDRLLSQFDVVTGH